MMTILSKHSNKLPVCWNTFQIDEDILYNLTKSVILYKTKTLIGRGGGNQMKKKKIPFWSFMLSSTVGGGGNVLFNDALNTFYLRLYGVGAQL